MTEVRMSLAEAGELLGIKPNSVRSRFKAGKIKGERDNSGKIWVWINKTKAANDKGSKKHVSKPSIETFETNEIKALQAHINTLSKQLSVATAELEVLRPKASQNDRLKAELAGKEEQMKLALSQVEDLRSRLDAEGTERRQRTAVLTDRREKPVEAPTERLTFMERLTGCRSS